MERPGRRVPPAAARLPRRYAARSLARRLCAEGARLARDDGVRERLRAENGRCRPAHAQLAPGIRRRGKHALGTYHPVGGAIFVRSEEHTSELQSLMRNFYAAFCLKQKNSCTCSPHITTTLLITSQIQHH